MTDRADPDADLRTTALLQPAQALLDEIGLWPRLAAARDTAGDDADRGCGRGNPGAAADRDFRADDLGLLPFGWNLPNWLMRREFAADLAARPGRSTAPARAWPIVLSPGNAVHVRLSDGAGPARGCWWAPTGAHSAVRQRSASGADHPLRAKGAGLRGHP